MSHVAPSDAEAAKEMMQVQLRAPHQGCSRLCTTLQYASRAQERADLVLLSDCLAALDACRLLMGGSLVPVTRFNGAAVGTGVRPPILFWGCWGCHISACRTQT